MIKYENDCCGCAAPAYPCMGDLCPLRQNPHYCCDECGEEQDIYEYDGEELCLDCIKTKLKKINS